ARSRRGAGALRARPGPARRGLLPHRRKVGGLTPFRRKWGLTPFSEASMKLTPSQIQQFDREGYLFFPSLFTPQEIKGLTDQVPALYAQRRPENVREKTGDVVRTNFAAHLYSAPFARL